jgi:ribosome biogenesis GTPase / thiamine phosphate phosphatase
MSGSLPRNRQSIAMSIDPAEERTADDSPRKVNKPKEVEKLWRKGTARWRYDGVEESETDFLDRKRSAPPKHQMVRPENERDALTIETGGPLVVLLDGDEEFRGRPRRSTTTENANATLITIGDRVRYIAAGTGDAVITHVYRRKSALSRKSVTSKDFEQVLVANIDQIIVVAAATLELLRPGLIDRYLIAAAMGGLAASICINKMDLVPVEDQPFVEEIALMYQDAGYRVDMTSCVTGEGIGELYNDLAEHLSAFSGHSGVGKTSLLNRLIPGATEKTRELSEQSQRGVHTTTKSMLFDLPNGGYIADTPGIREFGLYHYDRTELASYYPEFLRFADQCRFASCTHQHEPGCAVIQAVDDEEIHPIRYRNYLQILEAGE